MNDQTVKLIEQLASQLGTTSKYIWAVLIHQAPISATINMVEFIMIWLCGFLILKAHKSFLNDDNKVSYYEMQEGLSVPMGLLVVIWVVFAIVSLFMIKDIFNGFFSPEFWALDFILDKMTSVNN